MSNQAANDWVVGEIVRLLNEFFDVEPDDVTPESNFFEDLDMDSLDVVEIIVEIENLYGVAVEPELLDGVVTVEQVGDVLGRLAHEKGLVPEGKT